MAAQIRVLRRRIKSTQSIKKITRAMELIATSRIAKARARVDESRPDAEQITMVLAQLAQRAALDHPLLVERENTKKAAVLVVTSARGQAGGYNHNVLQEAEALPPPAIETMFDDVYEELTPALREQRAYLLAQARTKNPHHHG